MELYTWNLFERIPDKIQQPIKANFKICEN